MHQAAIGGALATIRRTAEAAALRGLLTKEMKGNNRPVVLMGDLNDTEHRVTNTLVTGEPSFRLFQSGREENSDKDCTRPPHCRNTEASETSTLHTYLRGGTKHSITFWCPNSSTITLRSESRISKSCASTTILLTIRASQRVIMGWSHRSLHTIRHAGRHSAKSISSPLGTIPCLLSVSLDVRIMAPRN